MDEDTKERDLQIYGFLKYLLYYPSTQFPPYIVLLYCALMLLKFLNNN